MPWLVQSCSFGCLVPTLSTTSGCTHCHIGRKGLGAVAQTLAWFRFQRSWWRSELGMWTKTFLKKMVHLCWQMFFTFKCLHQLFLLRANNFLWRGGWQSQTQTSCWGRHGSLPYMWANEGMCSDPEADATFVAHRRAADLYLSQIASLAVLHCQQRQVVGGHQFLHPLRNFSGCNNVDMIQPMWAAHAAVRGAQCVVFLHGQQSRPTACSDRAVCPTASKTGSVTDHWKIISHLDQDPIYRFTSWLSHWLTWICLREETFAAHAYWS